MTSQDDPEKPLWQVFKENPPEEIFIIFYKGKSGRWIFSSTYFKEEVAINKAKNMRQPTYVIKYDLKSQTKVMRPLRIRPALEE